MTTFNQVMNEFAESFESRARDDGESYVTTKDDCPEWVSTDLMRELHEALDDRMPDDWVYDTIDSIADALCHCEDADEAKEQLTSVADTLVDVYNQSRLGWLNSNLNNAYLCDDAQAEGFVSPTADLYTRIGCGQYLAIERLGYAVIDAVEQEAQNRDEEE